jgi:hypothetical protein
MQSSLPPELVPTGSSNLLMFVSTSCSIFLAIGQAIFQKRLEVNLSAILPSTLVEEIVSAGATNFQSLVPPSVNLSSVVEAYSRSITQVFVSNGLSTSGVFLRCKDFYGTTISSLYSLFSIYPPRHLSSHLSWRVAANGSP